LDFTYGFSFQEDNNWILAFIAETKIQFIDVNSNPISKSSFTQTSGYDIVTVNVHSNAAYIKITAGAQSSDHTTKTVEDGPGAINYDGTVGGAASTRNCHVKTDTWDSGYIKLYNGFNN
jgi:hypothetical protein